MIEFIFIAGIWINPMQIVTMHDIRKDRCMINLSHGRFQKGNSRAVYPKPCKEFIKLLKEQKK